MKRLILLAMMIGSLIAHGQMTEGDSQANIGGLLIASNFAQWTVPQGNQGGYSWSSPDFCKANYAGSTFNAFSNGTPIAIVDTGNPNNSEVVTVNQFNSNTGGCSIQVNPTHIHNTFFFRSATAGLGEALAFAGQQLYQVVITPNWTKLGGQTSMIIAGNGNANVTILDQRSSVIVPYLWNGTNYAANPFGAGPTPGGTTGAVVWNDGGNFGGFNGTGILQLNGSSAPTIAVPGTAYALPNANTTGTAGNLSGTPTLPNGTAAATQTTGDSSTKIATDAFVIANQSTATIPSTNLPLCGDNEAGVSRACVASTDFVPPSTTVNGNALSSNVVISASQITTGTLPHGQLPTLLPGDIPNNAANTSGTAANVSGTPTFPNGTLAITQSVGDNSARLATDAFVIANSSSAAAIPNTGSVLKGNMVAGQSVAATANVDFMGAVATSNYGYVPVSTGAGTSAYSWQQAALSFGSSYDQFIQQETNNANYTTLRVNTVNNVFYADGFTAAGAYTGIGVAQVAYAAATEYPLCQAVSYSGSNYIAIGHNNASITPGTNLSLWSVPVPNSGATTPWDCGAYTAAAYTYTHSIQAIYVSGGQYYTTQGFVEPNGLYAVNLQGGGIFGSFLSYTGTAATPMINRPDGGSNYTYLQIKNFIMDGGGHASSIMDLGQLNQSYIDEIQGQNIGPGAAGSGNHFFEFGLSPGDAFQMHASNMTWTGGQASTVAATITANVVGGAITSYTVNNGGSDYLPASATNVYHTTLLGYQGGTSNQPCTTMPANQPTVTVVSNAVTAVTPVGSGSALGVGCSGTIDVQVSAGFPVDWGIIDNASDSTFHDITGYAGQLGVLQVNAGNGNYYHIHPSVVRNGIQVNGSATFVGTECDDVYEYCFTFKQPFTGEAVSVVGAQGYVGGSPRRAPGSSPFFLATTATNVNFGTMASLCDASVGGPPTDWHEFVTPNGPIDTAAEYLTLAPAGMTVMGNDVTCGETSGDYSATFTTKSSGSGAGLGANTFTGVQSAPGFTLLPLGTAAGGGNFSSNSLLFNASYFNSTALTDAWTVTNVVGSGTSPNSALTFTHSGSAGTATIYFPNAILDAVNGFETSAFSSFAGGATLQGHNWIYGTWSEELGSGVAAAATIAVPPNALIFHVTGTAATVETITPPSSCAPSTSQACVIKLISDAGFIMGLTGNIAVAKTTVTGQLYILDYDYNTSKWYPTS